jgi:hypothetical protein
MATAHSNPRFVSGGQPTIMSHRKAASLKGIPDGVFGRAPVPRLARRVVRTCLPGGSGEVGGDDVGRVPSRLPRARNGGVGYENSPNTQPASWWEPWIKTWTWRPPISGVQVHA